MIPIIYYSYNLVTFPNNVIIIKTGKIKFSLKILFSVIVNLKSNQMGWVKRNSLYNILIHFRITYDYKITVMYTLIIYTKSHVSPTFEPNVRAIRKSKL